MKNNISFVALAYFICRANFIGISFMNIVNLAKQDAWLVIIIGTIISIIPLYIFYQLCKYEEDLPLSDKIELLFPKIHIIIKIILGFSIFGLALLNLWNLANFTTSQFLNKTPNFVIGISFIIPIIYLIIQKQEVIARVALILFYISIFLFVLCFIGLIPKFELNNLQPYLEYNPFKATLSIISYNTLPLITLLSFPNAKIKKSMWYGFFIAELSLLVATILIIAIMGINLAIIYQYPEFQILKKAFEGFVTYRLENMLATQWVIDIFIFITISLKFCNDLFKIQKKYILPIILVITFNYIFKDNTSANTIIENYLPIPIFIILFGIPLIMLIKTWFKPNNENKSITN